MALSTVPDGPCARVLGLNEREWEGNITFRARQGADLTRKPRNAFVIRWFRTLT
jgi:hypothetical protein